MEALVFDQAGEAETVLRYGAAEVPVPAEGEVLIQVQARVIQPADRLFISGRYRVRPKFPQVAGLEGAGVVDAVGKGVDERLIGRRVAFRNPGAWAAYAVAPVTRSYVVPDDIEPALACQFALNPLTAWGLLETAGLPKNGSLLVTAAKSAVARWLAALAQERGLQVTSAARDEGGWIAWDPSRPSDVTHGATLRDVLEPVRPAQGFDAVLDPIGGAQTTQLMDACAPGATIVSYGVLDDRPFEIQASRILYRNLRWQGFGIDLYLDRMPAAALAQASATIWRLMREQPQLLPIAARYGLGDYVRALSESVRFSHQGKVLFQQARG
jgi:NADPH:quinone reductase-like Zn-dependent oxidoreductase